MDSPSSREEDERTVLRASSRNVDSQSSVQPHPTWERSTSSIDSVVFRPARRSTTEIVGGVRLALLAGLLLLPLFARLRNKNFQTWRTEATTKHANTQRRCERTAKRHGADRYVRWRKGACWSTTAQQKRKKKERYPVSPLTRFQYCKSFIESKSIKTGKVLERLSQQHKNHGQ